MTPKKIYRLKTFHGTRIFYDDKRGVIHSVDAAVPEVFIELTDDTTRMFTERDGQKIFIGFDDAGQLRAESEPLSLSRVTNDDGTITIIHGEQFLSARQGTGTFDLRPKNLGWEHFTLEPSHMRLTHSGGG